MGCESSTGDATGPERQDFSDRILPQNQASTVREVSIMYYPILGRADPLTQMFEYHGQPYRKINVDQEQWSSMKDTEEAGEFNSLPMVKIYTRGSERNLG